MACDVTSIFGTQQAEHVACFLSKHLVFAVNEHASFLIGDWCLELLRLIKCEVPGGPLGWQSSVAE